MSTLMGARLKKGPPFFRRAPNRNGTLKPAWRTLILTKMQQKNCLLLQGGHHQSLKNKTGKKADVHHFGLLNLRICFLIARLEF